MFIVYSAKSQTDFIETKNAINSFTVRNDEKYVAFISDAKIVYVFNENFAHKDDYGNINHSPQKGKIIGNPSNSSIESLGVIRHLIKYPYKNEFVLIYFYRDDNRKVQYFFEVINSVSFEVIRSIKIALNNIHSVSCSMDGSFWNLAVLDNYRNKISHIFNYETIEEVSTIEPNTGFKGWMVDNKLIPQEGTERKFTNLTSNAIESEIWANLTKFSSIEGFHSLNSGT